MTDLSPRDAEIQRRWLLGENSGVIGKHLHMTRNSVIGIVHRRGWQHYHASPVKLPYPEREAKIARRKPRIMPTERLEQPPRPLGSPRKPVEPVPATNLACASNGPDALLLPLDGFGRRSMVILWSGEGSGVGLLEDARCSVVFTIEGPRLMELPAGPFGCILADPPWAVQFLGARRNYPFPDRRVAL